VIGYINSLLTMVNSLNGMIKTQSKVQLQGAFL